MRNIYSLLLALFLFSCSKEGTQVQIKKSECTPFEIADTYQYALLPGTDEWKGLQSLTEKVDTSQIPEPILRSISTDGLLETILNYPLINDYIFFDKMQSGFNRIKSEHNGFVEFYKRKEMVRVLVDRYESMSLECGNIYPPFSLNGEGSPAEISVLIVEFMIFQDDFLSKLNKQQQYNIFTLVYNKHIKKEDAIGKVVSAALLGKIMYNNNFAPFVAVCEETAFMKMFIESAPVYRPIDVYPTEIIEKKAKEFIDSW